MAILVATDFSRASIEASRVAAYLARALQLPMKIVHVLEPGAILPESLPKRTSGEVASQSITALRMINDARDALRDIWRDVACELLLGNVAPALANEVAMHPPQLLVVGGERTVTTHASERDLAESLAQSLPCAVLVVRPASLPLTAALTQNRRLRIFAAFDRAEARDPVVQWLRWLRKRMPCDVRAVQFYTPSIEYDRLGIAIDPATTTADTQLRDALDGELRASFFGLAGSGKLTLESKPRVHASSLDVLHAAMAAQADIIVIGSNRRSASETDPGSVALDVLRHSELPVICIALAVNQYDGAKPFIMMESSPAALARLPQAGLAAGATRASVGVNDNQELQ